MPVSSSLHPAQRFDAPSGIMSGTPLKEIVNRQLVALIGESFAAVVSGFNRRAFERCALDGLDELELMGRGEHIGRALAEQLPTSFAARCEVLMSSMGPELQATEGNGLQVFFYLPHSSLIAQGGRELTEQSSPADFDAGCRAIYELTKRMTGEFCIRPYLVNRRDECLERLAVWATDPNPHVRRLVSEGTRPRLPWAMRLSEFQQDPSFTPPLLELLKDDAELYVRRSVANHLADILKDHPEVAFGICDRWLDEIEAAKVSPPSKAARRWMVRHAVRLPAKRGEARALALRERAK